MRTNFLSLLLSVDANLGKVAATNFSLMLTAEETLSIPVTVDYGDIQLLRALAQAGQCACYLAAEWNLDALLTTIRSAYDGEISWGQFLSEHPKLFTFASTNDLPLARQALLQATDRYFAASDWIRRRLPETVRLFNYDPSSETEEADFRSRLVEMTNSLARAVSPRDATNCTVYLGAAFAGKVSPRSLLPIIQENCFELGTLPDPTFGGLIQGLSADEVEAGMSRVLIPHLLPLPRITLMPAANGSGARFLLNVAEGRGYVLEASTNLVDWQDYLGFVATDNHMEYEVPLAAKAKLQFYRLADRTLNMPVPPNNTFSGRIALTGLGIVANGYSLRTTEEPGEPWGGNSSIWWSWTAPESRAVVVSTSGSPRWFQTEVYTGSTLATLVPVASGNTPFEAVAGTTYHIRASTWAYELEPSGVRLTITALRSSVVPSVEFISPGSGQLFTAPANIVVQGQVSAGAQNIKTLRLYLNDELVASSAPPTISFTLTNTPCGAYHLRLVGGGDDQVEWYGWSYFTVRPPNDDFASRTRISGAPLAVAGSNLGATSEPGETDPDAGGRPSVWWSWTSTFKGTVTISAEGAFSTDWGYLELGAYAGSSVSNLFAIATDVSERRCGAQRAQITLSVTVGSVLQLAVRSWPQGDIALRIERNSPPTVNVLTPKGGERIFSPGNVSLSAAAADPDGSIARVDFLETSECSPRLIASVSAPPYSFPWTNLTGGTFTIVARATDDSGLSTDSAPVFFEVVPENDDFENRTAVNGLPAMATSSTAGATLEPNEPRQGDGYDGHSVWWSWTSPITRKVTATAEFLQYSWKHPAATLGVYTGTALTNLVLVGQDTPRYGVRAQVTFPAISGQTYQIVGDGLEGAKGELTLRLLANEPPTVGISYPTNDFALESVFPPEIPILASAQDSDGTISEIALSTDGGHSWSIGGSVSPLFMLWSGAGFGSHYLVARAIDDQGMSGYSAPIRIRLGHVPPANDHFANREFLSGVPVTVVGNNQGASPEEGEPANRWSVSFGSASVWWSWVAPSSGTFTLRATSQGMDYPALAVYTGATLQSLQEVAHHLSYRNTAQLSFKATAGVTYHFLFDDAYGCGGVFSLDLWR
jgi:hypothetical protein